MKNFNTNYENFPSRKPVPRFGNKFDYTRMRFIDTASKEEVLKQYELIKSKKSKLNSNERNLITKMVEE